MNQLFDTNSESYRQDPYAYLNDLRSKASVVPTPGGKIVLDYAAAESVLSDSKHSVRYIPTQISRIATAPIPNLEALGEFAIVFTDPPLHHRLRRLHMSAFGNKSIEAFTPRITKSIQAILEEVPVAQKVDVVSNIADKVPRIVLSDLLGIDAQYRDTVTEKLHHTRTVLEPTKITPRTLKRLENEFSSCVDIFQETIEQRRQEPGDDIISLLAAARNGGERLSDGEIQISCALTYIAGHETTKSVIAGGMKLFSEHPEQWQMLVDNRELLDSALDEVLRFEPPLHYTTRMASRDFELGGVEIISGEMILICIAAANRDPSIFSNPNDFNISRNKKQNFSFGIGMHNCIGRHLAKMEARLVFEYMLDKGLRLSREEGWNCDWLDAGPTTRSLEKFELCFT